LPQDIQGEQVRIGIDGETQPFTVNQSTNITVLELTFSQGAHTFEVELPFNKTPEASFTLTPSLPSVKDTVTFTDWSTDFDGKVISWRWQFGDGSSSTQQNPTHFYRSIGAYTVTLTVEDDNGARAEKIMTLVIVNLPPAVEFSYTPENPLMEETIRFKDESNDPEGGKNHVAWDFGDGEASTEGNAEHAYAKGGDFTVRLTVWDEEGASASTTEMISVTTTYILTIEVRDLIGLPIAAAEVEVGNQNRLMSQGRTSANGDYTNTGLVAGSYTIQVKHMGVTISATQVVSQDSMMQVRTPLSINVILVGVLGLAVLASILYLIWQKKT